MKDEIKKRLAPFIALLDAKYAPLLVAVAPQAYSVYLWLFPKPYDGFGEFFAVIGALGFEWVYVGAIAWADEGKSSKWTWITAVIALVFSVAVAYHVHEPTEHNWAWLHAGFPLVAFAYTINMYVATNKKPVATTATDSAHEHATESHPVTTAPQLVDTSATDLATYIVHLKDECNWTWKQIEAEIGKSRTWATKLYNKKKAASA